MTNNQVLRTPDPNQCQASINGGLDRCPNKPSWAVYEKFSHRENGKLSGISVCHQCRVSLEKMVGPDFAEFVPLNLNPTKED